MNGTPSSIPSGSRFPQMMVDQRPRYENQMRFRKQPRRGHPRKNQPKQYWIRK